MPLVSTFSHFFLAPVMKVANLLNSVSKGMSTFSHFSQIFNLGCIIIASSVNGGRIRAKREDGPPSDSQNAEGNYEILLSLFQ